MPEPLFRWFDDEKPQRDHFDIWKMARWIDMLTVCILPRFFFGTPPSWPFFVGKGFLCCWIWRLMVKSKVSGRILLGAETLRFPWLTWVNGWSWKGPSQVPPCTTCLDPRFLMCAFWGWKLKEHQPAWEKKDMEGFPTLPNCLLRFGFFQVGFFGVQMQFHQVFGSYRLYFYYYFCFVFFFPSGASWWRQNSNYHGITHNGHNATMLSQDKIIRLMNLFGGPEVQYAVCNYTSTPGGLEVEVDRFRENLLRWCSSWCFWHGGPLEYVLMYIYIYM